MRTIALGLAAISTFAIAQDRDRTFYLTHTDTIQQFQEVATAIRTIANIEKVSTNNDQKSLTVRATPAQIAMSEWLFNELDSPAAQPSVPHEYRDPGGTSDNKDEVVRVFYIPTAATVQDFQEEATLVRTISGILRVFTYNSRRALAVRGTAVQITLAEWLLKELQIELPSGTHVYEVSGTDDVVRVLRLPHTATVQDFQKAATQIREATKIMRVFTYNSPRVLAVRGTSEQIALAVRMTEDFNNPKTNSPPR